MLHDGAQGVAVGCGGFELCAGLGEPLFGGGEFGRHFVVALAAEPYGLLVRPVLDCRLLQPLVVPETGLAAGLKPGAMVRPVELFATPWARIFNGQLSDGVAYRASRLELVSVEAAQ